MADFPKRSKAKYRTLMCWLNYLYFKGIHAVLSRSLLYMGIDTTKPVFSVSDKATLISESPQLQRLARVENCNFTFRTFQKANNEGADQSVGIHRLRLVCTFVVSKPEDRFFFVSRPIYIYQKYQCFVMYVRVFV